MSSSTASSSSSGVVIVRKPGPASKKNPDANRPANRCPLFMSCDSEPLSEAQRQAYVRGTEHFLEQVKKLENLAKAAGNSLARNDDGTALLRTVQTTGAPAPVIPPAAGATPAAPGMVSQASGNVRLLMDPRTGRILGTLPNTAATPAPAVPAPIPVANVAPVVAVPAAAPAAIAPRLAPIQPPPQPAPAQAGNVIPVAPQNIGIAGRPVPQPASAAGRSSRRGPAAAAAAGTPPPSQVATIDLTSSDSSSSPSSSSQSKSSKSGYPALSVQPRANKSAAHLSSKRGELDTKVKQLLVMSNAKFTEWLMQQGLVLQEMWDPGPARTARSVKLKLAKHQDSRKFSHSGGYVWINDRAAAGSSSKFVSVFKGSLFELTNSSPTVLLKLMYHWACQTSVANVMQWVKVNQNVIDAHYHNFRCLALATVQDELWNLGGNGKFVEVGVISLGTTSADGKRREVRVEVLGVLDRSTGRIRLRATEPGQRTGRPQTQAERFAQIFKPLPVWVRTASSLVVDTSIDKERLRRIGFSKVVQTNVRKGAKEPAHLTNAAVMDYLKKVVPRMFQNSLSSLSTDQIQTFLDELSFREAMAHYPLLCFDALVQRVAKQTSVAVSGGGPWTTLVTRLAAISNNPYGDWRQLAHSQPASLSASATPPSYGIDSLPPSLRIVDPATSTSPASPYRVAQQKPQGLKRPPPGGSAAADVAQVIKKPREMVRLESYFYATLPGDAAALASEFKADMAFKCHLCKKVYMNNVEFARHLSLHVESDRAAAVDLVDLCQCKYCFKDFDTPFAMQNHLEEIHWKKGFDCVCRICEEGFKTKAGFFQHMFQHYRSEMPYSCSVCGFRSSFHKDAVDHFQEAHDRTDKLQCPRCLKTFSLFSNNQYNANVASSYVMHLQMHITKKSSCKKCCLTFHTDKEARAHFEKDHVSFSNVANVSEYEYQPGEEPTQMPKPDERGWKQASRGGTYSRPAAQQQAAFAAQNLDDVALYGLGGPEDCGECGKKMVNKQHFAAYLCCTKCRYSTCCSRAMSVHIGLFHQASRSRPIFDLGQPVMLEKEVFCCCGFSTRSGNKMAKHLGTHNCKTAYPTRESAKSAVQSLSSASFAPLVSLEVDGEEGGEGAGGEGLSSFDPSVVMAKAYKKDKKDREQVSAAGQQQGPLAFLGLQRRASTEEEEEEGVDSGEGFSGGGGGGKASSSSSSPPGGKSSPSVISILKKSGGGGGNGDG